MYDEHAESLRLLKALVSNQPLRPTHRKTLIQRIHERLLESAHGVTAQYTRIAEHIIKWRALPRLRDTSWQKSVNDAVAQLEDWEMEGGKLSKYIRGDAEFHGVRVDIAHIHDAGLRRAVSSYLRAHPGEREHDVERMFKAANPFPLTLSQLRSYPLADSDLPSHVTPLKKRR